MAYVIMAVGFTVESLILASHIDQIRTVQRQGIALGGELKKTQRQIAQLACELDAHVMPEERVVAPGNLCKRYTEQP